MNTLEHNAWTESWATFGASVDPVAVLVVSAHWFVRGTGVTAMARPRTIHDFAGFPDELFAVEYPAPGSPGLAADVAASVGGDVVLDEGEWGLDHGTWSVMAHLRPAADVPVVQLSLDATVDLEEHVDRGRRLAGLRRDGVLVLGSGNVVHHLGRMDWGRSDAAFDWARRFDEHVRDLMLRDPASVVTAASHPDFAAAVPTPEHFLPLLYLAGLADAAGRAPRVLVGGYAYGSISMTSYVLD